MTGVRAVLHAPLPRALLLALLILMLAAWAARAEPVPLHAHVIWARDTRVLIAADGDSLEVEDEQPVTFQRHGKPIAYGQVTATYARDLALVTLTWGSLDRPKDWDDLEIMTEPANQPRPKLRVGVPGRGRANLLFACEPVPPASLVLKGIYSIDRSTDRFVRAILIPEMRKVVTRWPDTLEIRAFGDESDEEIALERGELDVAVFWPGELSREMRERPEWRGFLTGFRIHGIVAARWIGPQPVDGADLERWIQPSMDTLNVEQFRGDLIAHGDAAMGGPHWSREGTLPPPSDPPGRLRYVVDSSSPGKRAIERSLNRGALSSPGSAPNVRVSYLDISVDAPDSTGFAYTFALGCPVLCPPRLRAYVRSLGVNSFANMPACGPLRRRP